MFAKRSSPSVRRGVLVVALFAGLALLGSSGAATASNTGPATASKLPRLEGPIVSVVRNRHEFKLRDRSRGTVKVEAKGSTRYVQLRGFGALHKGLKVKVKARRSNGEWIAVEIERVVSNHPPGYPPQTVRSVYHNQYSIVLGMPRLTSQTVDITISPGATDPDRDPLSYQWTASNGNITGSGLSGTWTRVVSNYQPVPGTVTVTARDGKGGTAVLHINYN